MYSLNGVCGRHLKFSLWGEFIARLQTFLNLFLILGHSFVVFLPSNANYSLFFFFFNKTLLRLFKLFIIDLSVIVLSKKTIIVGKPTQSQNISTNNTIDLTYHNYTCRNLSSQCTDWTCLTTHKGHNMAPPPHPIIFIKVNTELSDNS